jgi:hypothetical protein
MTCVEIPRIDADERGLGKAELSPRRHGEQQEDCQSREEPTTDEQGWEEIAKIAEIEKQKLYRGLTRMFADWEKAKLSPTEARRKSGYGNLYKSARFESGTQKTGVKGHPRSPQPKAKS